MFNCLDKLKQYNACLRKTICRNLSPKKNITEEDVTTLVELTIWGLEKDECLGQTIAQCMSDLLGATCQGNMSLFCMKMKEYGTFGASQGIIMAQSMVPLFKISDAALVTQFFDMAECLRCRGFHSMPAPFQTFCIILKSDDIQCAQAYLNLFQQTFSKDLPYKALKEIIDICPDLCRFFSQPKRLFQINQLTRIALFCPNWLRSFEKGIKNGLNDLSESSLIHFIDIGIERFATDPLKGDKYFSLESELGIKQFDDLQDAAILSRLSHQLNYYIKARTNLDIAIRPISELLDKYPMSPLSVCSDGMSIYLPDEMRLAPTKDENIAIYKCLLRLESAYFEYGTFDFDLEKYILLTHSTTDFYQHLRLSDLGVFFSQFNILALANDLFTIFEQGRIRINISNQYPGMLRNTLPFMQQEAERQIDIMDHVNPVYYLYTQIALGMPASVWRRMNIMSCKPFDDIITNFNKIMHDEYNTVEQSARLVWKWYPHIVNRLENSESYPPIDLPFNRRLQFDLINDTWENLDIKAKVIRQKLEDSGIHVFQSDTRKLLQKTGGILSLKDIQALNANHPNQTDNDMDALTRFIHEEKDSYVSNENSETNSVACYKEWDNHRGDYILHHAHVYDRIIQPEQDLSNCFYEETLTHYQGILKHIRRSFDYLRPVDIQMMRRWKEGDTFDYAALIDYAVDRRSRITASDNLYLKRIKQTRDVAVLLLVDLSRSTGYVLPNSNKTVLDIEKEAIVLFCEALQFSEDKLAIAGFSGLGHKRIDYYHIKDFEDNQADLIKQRISSMTSYRSTRMGAAIRHAKEILKPISAKNRLLIILSDGLPNDLNYKSDYAIKDSQMAIREVRAIDIHVHGIVITDSIYNQLDDLYGKGKYNRIADISDLPDKLPMIYQRLTR